MNFASLALLALSLSHIRAALLYDQWEALMSVYDEAGVL
jgi:hypothetical protein